MSIEEIGCCGAYCRTCKEFTENRCYGCKLGYSDGTRKISKAKCKIKICCMGKKYNSCADCDEYNSCPIIQGFYNKKGYKYKKYQEAVEFIRANGYDKFIVMADGWNNQYGKYRK
ncbi:MAG: DUF3795 domain-containing protein [candidate division Zixibacteria bacterium]|nr:DUF3795 domain-containing protein [candidate division Zixibacteria bacterium]